MLNSCAPFLIIFFADYSTSLIKKFGSATIFKNIKEKIKSGIVPGFDCQRRRGLLLNRGLSAINFIPLT